MSLPAAIREQVRQRAHYACEWCGVAEADTGGELTIDHFQPQAKGGTDDWENLVYSCPRCNQYKADYWPTQPGEPLLWHPQQESRETHFLALADGTLCPVTPVGAFTLRRLRLNRPPLVAYRVRQFRQHETRRLLERYREVVRLLEQLSHHQAVLLEEQRTLLDEQRTLLNLLKQQRQ